MAGRHSSNNSNTGNNQQHRQHQQHNQQQQGAPFNRGQAFNLRKSARCLCKLFVVAAVLLLLLLLLLFFSILFFLACESCNSQAINLLPIAQTCQTRLQAAFNVIVTEKKNIIRKSQKTEKSITMITGL